MGSAYSAIGNDRTALDFYYKALSHKGKPKDDDISAFISQSYFGLNQLDSAFLYAQKAYDIVVSIKSNWPVPYFLMGDIAIKKNQFNEALFYYRLATSISTVKNDFVQGFNGMAAIFDKKSQIDSAIYYSKKAFREGQNASLIPQMIVASSLLAKIYTKKNITDSAFKYLKLTVALKDSLFSMEKVKRMENLSFNEQLRQQEIVTEHEQLWNKIKMYTLFTCFCANG